MEKYYLAIDIGASSGRHILGRLKDGKLMTEEIHRFPNGAHLNENGTLCWDTEHLFREIIVGLKKCKEQNKIPVSLGIDTWGVDFVLLDESGTQIGNAVSYRDKRTNHAEALLNNRITEAELYERTGIQKQKFNTVYQLAALQKTAPEQLRNARYFLMIPDYLNYRLTGRFAQEYTNATTTQLINSKTCTWDREIIKKLELPDKLFIDLSEPGMVLGNLSPEIAAMAGFQTAVILTASHDTASAVMAVPSLREDTAFLSSGTWSLMGAERTEPDCSSQSRALNFTNEGGYQRRYRYLKNIMGLWMIQSIRHELDDRFSFSELCQLAEECRIDSLVDCNAECFLAPDSMCKATRSFCRATNQEVPETPGELARVIYRSLARCYQQTVRELEKQTGITLTVIHIIGGGANADYLNRLTADATGKVVYAGPAEATAIGNLTAQMLSGGAFASLEEARRCIAQSCPIKTYLPDKQ